MIAKYSVLKILIKYKMYNYIHLYEVKFDLLGKLGY